MKIKSKQDLLKKFDELKDNKLDLASDEDLSIAIMNLISLEEHFFFTAQKTGKSEYYKFLDQIRGMRKDLLKRIIKEYEGEVWCISKHLLAASMRLMEVGTKHLGKQEYKQAEEMFDKSYDLYSLFWALNMNMINLDGFKKIDDDVIDKNEQQKKMAQKSSASTTPLAVKKAQSVSEKTDSKAPVSMFEKTRDLVKNLINCCIE
ncbi:MAG: hypothetical protein Q3996_00025 [Candidatus Saccharibacteria bacterium]|nr:hypothetical protein [Candidatus Saccharibacteria bacterium]